MRFTNSHLVLTAALAVALLLALTDFSPAVIESFGDLEGIDARVCVDCIILSQKASKNGLTLIVQDVNGEEMRAYCKDGLFDNTTALPCPARLIGDVSSSNPGIIFVESVKIAGVQGQV